jgi:anion-transporting  ArsA/GET3 family ATPase
MSSSPPPAAAGSPGSPGSPGSAGLADLVENRSIVVCCGSGGVGKTTTAAAVALLAAERGRRAVVVTIDPAKRLADALGLRGGLSDELRRIEGPWPGELWATMLDTKATFDALVRRHAGDAAQAERILANRFYQNISGSLSGTQEYMAAEKLYELHTERGFDLVVVDTPPTRDALEFLDAPARLTRFLDHRLYRVLTTPTRLYLKAVNVAAQAFLRTASKVVGGDVIGDAIAFFQAFDGMEAGFRSRAAHVIELLRAPETAYVLVTSPRRDAIDEAEFFASELRATGRTVAALVVNRVHPRFGTGTAADADAQADGATGPAVAGWRNLAELRRVAEREAAQLAELRAGIGSAPTTQVPLLAADVHDLDGLRVVARELAAPAG